MRYLVKKKDLIEGNTKRVFDIGFCLREVPMEEAGEHPIELHLPADDAGDDLVHQSLVELVHLGSAHLSVERAVEVRARPLDAVQDLYGNTARTPVEVCFIVVEAHMHWILHKTLRQCSLKR